MHPPFDVTPYNASFSGKWLIIARLFVSYKCTFQRDLATYVPILVSDAQLIARPHTARLPQYRQLHGPQPGLEHQQVGRWMCIMCDRVDTPHRELKSTRFCLTLIHNPTATTSTATARASPRARPPRLSRRSTRPPAPAPCRPSRSATWSRPPSTAWPCAFKTTRRVLATSARGRSSSARRRRLPSRRTRRTTSVSEVQNVSSFGLNSVGRLTDSADRRALSNTNPTAQATTTGARSAAHTTPSCRATTSRRITCMRPATRTTPRNRRRRLKASRAPAATAPSRPWP